MPGGEIEFHRVPTLRCRARHGDGNAVIFRLLPSAYGKPHTAEHGGEPRTVEGAADRGPDGFAFPEAHVADARDLDLERSPGDEMRLYSSILRVVARLAIEPTGVERRAEYAIDGRKRAQVRRRIGRGKSRPVHYGWRGQGDAQQHRVAGRQRRPQGPQHANGTDRGHSAERIAKTQVESWSRELVGEG